MLARVGAPARKQKQLQTLGAGRLACGLTLHSRPATPRSRHPGRLGQSEVGTRRIDSGRSDTTDLTEIAVAVRSGSHPGNTSSRRPAQQLWEAAVGSSCGNMAVPHPLAEHLHGGRSAHMRGGRRATPASARRSLHADVTPAQGSAVRSSPAQNTFQRHTRIRGSIRRRLNLRRSPHPRTGRYRGCMHATWRGYVLSPQQGH